MGDYTDVSRVQSGVSAGTRFTPEVAQSRRWMDMNPASKKKARKERRESQKGLTKVWIDKAQKLVGVDFDDRVNMVWRDASEQEKLRGAIPLLRKAHEYMVNEGGALMTSAPPLKPAIDALVASGVKWARTKAYIILMADATFFAYKPSWTSRTKYSGHVFASQKFLDSIPPINDADLDEKPYKGVYIWKGIKVKSESRKNIVERLKECCEINPRRPTEAQKKKRREWVKKKKAAETAKKSAATATTKKSTSPPKQTRTSSPKVISPTRNNFVEGSWGSNDLNADQTRRLPSPRNMKKNPSTNAPPPTFWSRLTGQG